MIENDNKDAVGWIHPSRENQLRAPVWSSRAVRTVVPAYFGSTTVVYTDTHDEQTGADGAFEETVPEDKQVPLDDRVEDAPDDSASTDGTQDVLTETKTYEQRLEKAYQRGVNEGKAKAEEQIRLELEKEFEEKALLMTKRLGTLLGQIRKESIDVIVELANAMTRRIINRDPDEEWILKNIQSCLDKRIPNGPMRLRVNPRIRDRLLAMDPLPAWMEEMTPEGPAVKLSADPNMEPGDCILESDKMRIDASLDVQADSVRQVVQSLMSEKLFVEDS